MSSIEPNEGACEEDGGREVAFSFVISCSNGSVWLESGEDVFDEMPAFIEVFVIVSWEFSVRFGRDDNFDTGSGKRGDKAGIGIVAFVGQDGFNGAVGDDAWQEGIGAFQVAGLSGGNVEVEWIAQRVRHQADLTGQPSLGAPQCLLLLRLFLRQSLRQGRP